MTDATVELSSLTVHYREAGPGDGIPVVCLHGNLGSGRWFERVLDLPGCHVYALDLPNFGVSSAMPGEVTLEGYGRYVSQFREALGLDHPILVAHSLGGGVALTVVAREPEAWSGLVLIDSAAPTGLQTPVERHPLIEMMRANRALLTQGLGAVVPTMNDPFFLERLVDDAVLMAPSAWIGNAVALTNFNVTGKPAVFTAPVLVLWGRRDVLVTEAMAEETAAAFPNARLERLESVGHSVIVEDPALFQQHFQTFLKSLANRRNP